MNKVIKFVAVLFIVITVGFVIEFIMIGLNSVFEQIADGIINLLF